YIPLFFKFLAYLDLPLLVTVYFALMRRSPIAGTFIGAFIGLAQDSLSKYPLGTYGIVKTLVGYFAASVGLRFDVDHAFIRLMLGCNQKTNRDPVVAYDEDTVSDALDSLRAKRLARPSSAHSRVAKYEHSILEVFNLGRREMALLCTLMLRGPQTVGELHGRS